MQSRIKKIFWITLISLVPTLALWAPFILRIGKFWGIPLPKEGMATIVANYDGPLFLVVAKTFYSKEKITANFSFDLPAEYYPAHFPLFPLLIRLVSPITGFPYGMLSVTLSSSILAIYFFSKLIKEYTNEKDALWATFVFAIFPARWLIVRSVGSAEPLFLASIIASVYYFNKKKFFISAVWGAIAQMTKSPAILLFVAYTISFFLPRIKQLLSSPHENLKTLQVTKFYPLFLIPTSLIGLFSFYKLRIEDFWAYFHSGDNIHLFFPPFQIFNFSQPWVGTFWLEEIILVYLFGLLGLIKLIRLRQDSLAWFVGVFFISIIFVSHRDIIRYSLPIVPFLHVAFADTIVKKEFKLVMMFLILPIYLFSLTFISQNVMPIPDWAPLL